MGEVYLLRVQIGGSQAGNAFPGSLSMTSFPKIYNHWRKIVVRRQKICPQVEFWNGVFIFCKPLFRFGVFFILILIISMTVCFCWPKSSPISHPFSTCVFVIRCFFNVCHGVSETVLSVA